MNPDTAPSAFPFLLEAVVGGSIGAFIAVLFSLFGKRALKFFPDILLGAAGFMGGIFLTPHIPWRLNTVMYRAGNTVIRTTSRHYQYPYRVGFLVAALLPVIYEGIRIIWERRAKAKP